MTSAFGIPNEKQPSLSVRDADELKQTAIAYGVPFVDRIADDMLDPERVGGLPVEWARAHLLLPVKIDGRGAVLTVDPGQVEAQAYLSLLAGEDLQPVVAPSAVIADAIERCYYRREHSPGDFLQGLPEEGGARPRSGAEASDLFEASQHAPVTHLVNLIVLDALKKGASDIHVEPFAARLRVRYRMDGVLYEQTSPPKRIEEALVSRLKVMARLDIAEKRLPQDGMARVRVGDREIDMRVATVPVAEGERVVLRLLDQSSALLPLEALGMEGATLATFRELLLAPHGILVVCGPTGSGKTTTLYAALSQLDASRQNIITIEDPIEYQLADIGQIQVKPKIGLTFASGLRHILRQDPDVVLVGETRDTETAEIAVRASLTGHLVFTTLHTNDAPGAVTRLIDMGVDARLLATCLRGVLAQRLVRTLCPRCKRETSPARAAARAESKTAQALLEGHKTWEPAGCPFCLEGYKGRAGLFELLTMDEPLRKAVRRGDSDSAQLRQLAEAAGMRSLLADGMNKARTGLTSVAEALAATG